MVMPPVDIKLWLYFNQLPLKMQKRHFHVLLINKTRPIVMWTKYLCLPLKTDTTTPKLEKASLTTCSLMNSGRKKVTKIGSLPSLKGPTGRNYGMFAEIKACFRTTKTVPESFSFAVFDPETKTNFEGESMYRTPIPVTPSDSRIRKISDSKILGFLRGQYVAKQWFPLNLSSVTLIQRLVPNSSCSRVLQASGFGSWFSSGAKTQSSSEGRIKLNIHYIMTAYVGVIRTHWLLSWFLIRSI